MNTSYTAANNVIMMPFQHLKMTSFVILNTVNISN